jgi:hypothetical protein
VVSANAVFHYFEKLLEVHWKYFTHDHFQSIKKKKLLIESRVWLRNLKWKTAGRTKSVFQWHYKYSFARNKYRVDCAANNKKSLEF